MDRPRKEKEAFKDINKIDKFLEVIESNNENLSYLVDNYFYDNNIEIAINCLKALKDNQEEEFIDFMHYVDRKLNFPGQGKENRRHKIPTIFAGAIYLDKFSKQFNIYTDAQKMIIAKYSIPEDINFYMNINNCFSKEIMDAIIYKTRNWTFQDDYMGIAYKYKDRKSEDEIIDYIFEHDDKDLILESYNDYQEALEKAGIIDESRRL